MNRRNYYRVLHVQPDAPPEVVRAAYRALMARHHPDKGGDHAEAVLLNEAWAVLGNASARAEYDARRARTGARPRTGREARAASPTPDVDPRVDAAPPPSGAGTCLFCGQQHAGRATICARCSAPLTPPKPVTTRAATGGERRTLPRVSRADWGTLVPTWQGDALDIRLRNLSLGGVSFYAGVALAVGARVRVTAAAFDAIVEIVHCKHFEQIFVVQGVFRTVGFAPSAGSRSTAGRS